MMSNVIDIARMHNLLDAIQQEALHQRELSSTSGDVHEEIHGALVRILHNYDGGSSFSSSL